MRIRKTSTVDISAEINDIGDLLTVAPRTDSIPPIGSPEKKVEGRLNVKAINLPLSIILQIKHKNKL